MQRKREKAHRDGYEEDEEEESTSSDLGSGSGSDLESKHPEMAFSDLFLFNSSPKSRASSNKAPLCVSNGFLFLAGALTAFLLVYSFSDYVTHQPPDPDSRSELTDLDSTLIPQISPPRDCSDAAGKGADLGFDPPETTFYDDPDLSYSIGSKIQNWDEKRKRWLDLHPSFSSSVSERVLVVTGSQSGPCKNPVGDHLLLRFFKNKVDYCRIHGYGIWYNNVLVHPEMYSFWAKLPAVKAAMLAHPEAEWVWWVDSDALFTDMDFKLPLGRYKAHNLVVHGWAHMIHEEKSWTGLNAGVFLIRNCQWSMDFIEEWAGMGPQGPDFIKWGQIQQSLLKDKSFPQSDDQAALIYLLVHDKEKWGPRVYLEGEYYLEGYWRDIIGTFGNITRKYEELEWEERGLRRRHAEAVSECYGARVEAYVKDWGGGRGSMRRPPVTHFAGCQLCGGETGDHDVECREGMIRAVNFADNQVLRSYGFVRPDLLDSDTVRPLPFDAAV